MTASGMRAYGAVLFDLDGTIYLAGGPTGTGNSATALPGAPAFVDG